jgi:2-polyprenyl-3-methyl-5-hydroxy-6-metoxy-1,4-benzoquinol methylase
MQSLARLGGSVTGVDASREAIGAAQMHKQADASLGQNLQYREGTAEQLQAQGSHNPGPDL